LDSRFLDVFPKEMRYAQARREDQEEDDGERYPPIEQDGEGEQQRDVCQVKAVGDLSQVGRY
jgi:hypothetical protein